MLKGDKKRRSGDRKKRNRWKQKRAQIRKLEIREVGKGKNQRGAKKSQENKMHWKMIEIIFSTQRKGGKSGKNKEFKLQRRL